MLQRDDYEHPVPEPWRSKFKEIACAFATDDFQLRNACVEGVEPVERGIADHIASNVAAYGEPLAPLNDATWERSVYRWMNGYWQVLVDLTTEGEPVSDLTLHARLDEPDGCYLTIESVHVP
ncbi:hypothetical protein GCM10022280_12780 [Sphingomonas swuensis]|uniref:DUF7668 domain-containing protein n=1 Tax=Sphingomonas swuensis TaxID=977800 RepID=A0ABP7SRN0_9SPHN